MTIWDLKTTPAGVAWDAVRIPASPGVRLWMRLTATPDTRVRLGPVVISDQSQATYWLIPTGSRGADWPEPCRLLAAGAWLVLPGADNPACAARWLHLPDDPLQLTGTVWLADALNHHPTLEVQP